jgi:hypothetical protein
MLTMVVLWATLPALACLTPPPSHACCRHMMQDCDSSMMAANLACCDAHSSDTGIPASPATHASGIDLLAHACAATRISATAFDGFAASRIAETPPRTPLSSDTSVLRV